MWQRWLRYIRNFFGFSRTEARSFVVLASLLLLLYVGLLVYRLLPAKRYNPQADQQQLDSLIARLQAADSISTRPAAPLAWQAGEEERQLFAFNPNTISQDSLLALGFPPYLAQRLLNYRSKGGQFRKKEDLQKLYGLSPDLYQQLEPYIYIPERRQQQPAAYAAPPERETSRPAPTAAAPLNLNTADSMQLQAVRGIGPVLSSRIVKYRESLGGFVSAEQLREVWGLPPETADVLLERGYVAADAELRRLPLNQADVSQLARHPYISRKQAELIVAYRTQHGNFRQAEDLLRIHTLEESFVRKVAPYLNFEAP